GYTDKSCGNFGCHARNPSRRGQCRRIEKGGAEPYSQPHQRAYPTNLEFRHWAERPRPEYLASPAGHSGQRVERLEPHRPLDYAHRLPTDPRTAATRPPGPTDRGLRLGRHEPLILPFPEEEQGDLGRRADVGITYGNQHDVSRVGKTQHEAVGGRAGAALAFYDGVPCQQLLVCRRSFRSR